MVSKRIIVCLFLLAQLSCKEKYDPSVEGSANGFLVVEANIATGGDWSVARLTRTVPVYDTAQIISEPGALVWVEGDNNFVKELSNRGDGYYKDSGLNIIPGSKYRLRIKIGSKDYVSDYVVAKTSPPIDSVGWFRDNGGVVIHVSSHDDSKQTQFYRWEYDEVWETRARYFSTIKTVNGVMMKRNFPQDDVYTCWRYNSSSSFLLENTAHFAEDKVVNHQVNYIVNSDDRLSVRYSVLVKQYALDQGAYDFFQLMKRNTDDIGSIYSPQPSEIRGNIRCTTDPSEYILGYVTVSSVSTQRLFILGSEFPDWGYPFECLSLKVPGDASFNYSTYLVNGIVVYNIIPLIPTPEIYLSEQKCVDCTVTGGTKNKPSFW